ncbi:unannotated protein [freshwater metagenome]|uniref:Unannotated protein n=1 Tax=freshwater metagenome TaxID=449393 RepID=A0A6J7GFC6_9ZZZZ|nr:hypothetical protein [Actinomycetota bacterium]
MNPGALIAVVLFSIACVAVLAATYAGMDPKGAQDLWDDIAIYVYLLGGVTGFFGALWIFSSFVRWRNRKRRTYTRYQLVLSQSDEATVETVAAAYETLVQTIRVSTLSRMSTGQPYVAFESWFTPSRDGGETGMVRLMLVCEDHTLRGVMGALRQAYPDLTVRPHSSADPSVPLRITAVNFNPGHVLRVNKSRTYTAPLVTAAGPGESDARSTMAAVIRQQQALGRVSSVRWCIMPAGDWVDSSTVRRLQAASSPGMGGLQFGPINRPDPATSTDINQAMMLGGGAMSYLELQAAVEQGTVTHPRTGKTRPESFGEMMNACRQLLGPAMSRRALNQLTHRYMILRQPLYRRRWATAEPPLWPQPNGSTLVSPRELGALMELPSLGSEHSLPLQRSTVPQLNAPPGLARASIIDLPVPPEVPLTGPPPGRSAHTAPADDEAPIEVVDAELVDDTPQER